MTHKVKVIIGDLAEHTIQQSLVYANKLNARMDGDMELTFVSVNYSGDYPELLKREQQVQTNHRGVLINNFYGQEYLQSDITNNVDNYLTTFFDDAEVQKVTDDKEQVMYMKDETVRARVKAVRNVFLYDLLNDKTGTVEQRLFVNSARNIQVIRYFEPVQNKLLHEEYVDTELKPFFKIGFDERKKQESFTLLRDEQQIVHSRLDVNDIWLHEVIDDDDVILNLDLALAILFETWDDIEKVFDLSKNMTQ